MRTQAFAVVVLTNDHGTCELIWLAETYISGAKTPLKYTCTPPSVVGNGADPAGADTGALSVKLLPRMATSPPGAKAAASPPPERLAPLAVAVTVALVEMVVASVILSPALPAVRAVTTTSSAGASPIASTFGSPFPALISATSPLTIDAKSSPLCTVYV